jgi:hypothetical protein
MKQRQSHIFGVCVCESVDKRPGVDSYDDSAVMVLARPSKYTVPLGDEVVVVVAVVVGVVVVVALVVVVGFETVSVYDEGGAWWVPSVRSHACPN